MGWKPLLGNQKLTEFLNLDSFKMSGGARWGVILSLGGTSSSGGEVKHASKSPLVAALAFFIIGIASIPLSFALENRIFFLLGYLATPVFTLMCVAWDALAQRSGSRDPWFSVNKKLSLAIRAIAIASFIPAGIQIWQIALWVGERAVQNGWFQ